MPGLMFDSDDPSVLLQSFLSGCRIATYADLVTPAILSEAGARLIVIDRGQGDPHGLATVADIEPGALSVADGTNRIRQWIAEDRPYPTAYHDRDIWAQIDGALGGLPYHHWVATLDSTMSPDGKRPDVVQFAGASAVGFHADVSVVWNDEWRAVPGLPTAAQVAKVKAIANMVTSSLAALPGAIKAL